LISSNKFPIFSNQHIKQGLDNISYLCHSHWRLSQ